MNEDTTVQPRACDRTFELDDISIRSGGDGRTVVAYAAVFDAPAEIHDRDGHYMETLSRTSFDKTIKERAGKIQVFYNHGKTLFGTPSERFSIPLGTPEEIKPDGRGLLTVTRYNRGPLADEILESIRNGDVRGQSFSGKFTRSQRTRGTGMDNITRSEVALTEYGPTPIPAYSDAAIVGVRMEELVDTLGGLSDEDKDKLFQLLSTSRHVTPLTATDAGSATSVTNDTPAESHLSGPTPNERARVLRLAGVLT